MKENAVGKGEELIEWPPRSRKYISINREKNKDWKSETSRCRLRLQKYCVGNGVDLGYGGDAITSEAITIDLERPYGAPGWIRTNCDPQNLKGDARNLYWFKNNSLDFVYSSHLFEDFNPQRMVAILSEWFRVIKFGGLLVLYLPNQEKYVKYCEEHNQRPNPNHKVKNFDLNFFKGLLEKVNNLDFEVIYENPICDEYSFEIVVKKGKKGITYL